MGGIIASSGGGDLPGVRGRELGEEATMVTKREK